MCRILRTPTPNGEETAPAEACRNGTDACPIVPECDSFSVDGPELAQTSAKVRASPSLRRCAGYSVHPRPSERKRHQQRHAGMAQTHAPSCRNVTPSLSTGPELAQTSAKVRASPSLRRCAGYSVHPRPTERETAPAEACRNGTDACPIVPECDSFSVDGPELAQTSAKVRASPSLRRCAGYSVHPRPTERKRHQ